MINYRSFLPVIIAHAQRDDSGCATDFVQLIVRNGLFNIWIIYLIIIVLVKMAARFPEPSVAMDPVEAAMNQTFDNLFFSVNKRRVAVLLEYRGKKDGMRAEKKACVKSREQLLQVKELVV